MATRLSIKSVLDEICVDIKKAIQAIYIKDADVLPNSDLVKSVEVTNKRNVINVFANDYVKYIESGRKKFTKKVPIAAILVFMRKRKISPTKGITKNQLAYIIQNAIYTNGIKGKKGLNKKVEKVTGQIMLTSLRKYFKVSVKNNELIVGEKR